MPRYAQTCIRRHGGSSSRDRIVRVVNGPLSSFDRSPSHRSRPGLLWHTPWTRFCAWKHSKERRMAATGGLPRLYRDDAYARYLCILLYADMAMRVLD
jgi:hypothetical protein